MNGTTDEIQDFKILFGNRFMGISTTLFILTGLVLNPLSFYIYSKPTFDKAPAVVYLKENPLLSSTWKSFVRFGYFGYYSDYSVCNSFVRLWSQITQFIRLQIFLVLCILYMFIISLIGSIHIIRSLLEYQICESIQDLIGQKFSIFNHFWPCHFQCCSIFANDLLLQHSRSNRSGNESNSCCRMSSVK